MFRKNPRTTDYKDTVNFKPLSAYLHCTSDFFKKRKKLDEKKEYFYVKLAIKTDRKLPRVVYVFYLANQITCHNKHPQI